MTGSDEEALSKAESVREALQDMEQTKRKDERDEERSIQFETALRERIRFLNETILRYLPKEEGMQKEILSACNYSVENGGKRIRPLLMESAYFLCRLSEEERRAGKNGLGKPCPKDGGDPEGAGLETETAGGREQLKSKSPEALYARFQAEYETLLAPFLAAIEMIHSSSLVHDDLPCMDNDRLRRGKPSTWAKYGEDMGTLAGDGLMIYAFETACRAMNLQEIKRFAREQKSLDGSVVSNYLEAGGERACRILKAIDILARKTGIFGMIGGQTVDVMLTGKTPEDAQLTYIYRQKTGALLEASLMIGAVLSGASEETVAELRLAASELGMAFQIQDDILDETSSTEALGKTAGSDARNGKRTIAARLGLPRAKEEVRRYTESAVRRIQGIGDYPFLLELCTWLIDRKH